MFVDMVCVKTGLQMLNIAHAASSHILTPLLQLHTCPGTIQTVFRGADALIVPLKLEETQRCQCNSFIY